MTLDPTCRHIAPTWQTCESTSKLRQALFCSDFGPLRWKVRGVSSPDSGLSAETARSTQNRRTMIALIAIYISVRGPPWKNPCVVSSSSSSSSSSYLSFCFFLLAWLATVKLRFRKTGQQQLLLCSALCFSPPPSLSLSFSNTHTHTHTHRLFSSLSLTLQPGILEFGCLFSMENVNGESSDALNVRWSVILRHKPSVFHSEQHLFYQADSEWLFSMVGSGRGDTHTHIDQTSRTRPHYKPHILPRWLRPSFFSVCFSCQTMCLLTVCWPFCIRLSFPFKATHTHRAMNSCFVPWLWTW